MSLRKKINAVFSPVCAKKDALQLKDNIREYNNLRKDKPHICLAPFNSLRFERYGRVQVCCHNNTFVAGYYPSESLADIWNGQKLKEFRNLITNNNLDVGCKTCKEALIERRFESVSARMFDNYPISNNYPSMLDFKADDTCNLDCIMCSPFGSSLKTSEYTANPKTLFPYDDAFLSELDAFIPALKEIRFSGGEPFLSGFYPKIWERVLQKNPECIIRIQTNGHFLNNSIKALLERGRFSINVSIDSLIPDTYSKIRRHGNLERVLKNIDYFSDYCQRRQTSFGITVCPMRHNAEELPALTDFAGKKNALIWFSSVLYPPKLALWNMPANDLLNILSEIKKNTIAENSNIQKQNKKLLGEYIKTLESWHLKALKMPDEPCFKPAEYQRAIYHAIDNYFEQSVFLNDTEKRERQEFFINKVDSIMQQLGQHYYVLSSFKFLLDCFSVNMLLEILEAENEKDIISSLMAMAHSGK